MERKYLRAKEILQDLEEMKCQVLRLERSIMYLENRCTRTTGRYTAVTGTGSGGRSELLEQLTDKKDDLEAMKRSLKRQERKLEQWINQLPNPRWRMVLRYHYLDGMELQEVAEMMGKATGQTFSMHQIYRFHAQALRSADKLWPLN